MSGLRRLAGQQGGNVAGVTAAALIAALALIKPWEGRKNHAYRDIVGVVTICEGVTQGVRMGDYKTDAECDALLRETVAKHAAPIVRCLTRPIPDASMGAFISLAYNIGPSAFCRSSVARKANAGDLRGACDAMLAWNRAGGRVVRGLVNRRNAERTVCLRGVT